MTRFLTRRVWVPALLLVVVAVIAVVVIARANCMFEQERPERVPQLHGRGVDDLVAELGSPEHDRTFTIGDIGDKLRVVLFQHYPRTVQENLQVPIRELRWTSRCHKLVVWCHSVEGRWVVLDTMRYGKRVAF
jgi:hypothetical protein